MPTSPRSILTGSPEHVNATPLNLAAMPVIERVCGVDFSGAAKSGKTAWLAECDVCAPPAGAQPPSRPQERGMPHSGCGLYPSVLHLRGLSPLGRLAGSDDREAVCEYLVSRILGSDCTLWGMDFPFALPIELGGHCWKQQLGQVKRFESHADGSKSLAASFGRSLATQATRVASHGRIRRQTDTETATPFDSYHYRIIYQTFHGMRDVLLPIASDNSTAVLPFQYMKLASARRLVVESCPASFLKRVGLPSMLYKQSAGRAPTEKHRQTRNAILRSLRPNPAAKRSEQGMPDVSVDFNTYRRRQMMDDPGGDAIDAVLAAAASWSAVSSVDHLEITRHARYPAEGYVYV